MEFTFLLPFVVFAILGLGAFLLGRRIANRQGNRLKKIEAVPMVKGSAVARHAQGMAKMTGKIIAPAGTLSSPIKNIPCAYYRLIVEEEQTRTSTDSKGRTRTSKVCVKFIDAAKSVVCGIADKEGAIEVSMIEADTMLADAGKEQSGMFSDVSPHLRRMIQEEYGKDTDGNWFTKKKLRIREQILEVGQRALVIGKVKLVRTNRGVRPRFVRGKEPLLVTDKTEKEVREHFKRAVWWGNVSRVGGAGCGSLALVLGVVLALFLGYQRFIVGRPVLGPGVQEPRDVAADVLKGMRSRDKWVRRRSVEPLGKGPEGELAGKKAEIKAGLMNLLAEQDHDVYGVAAGVLPMWAEKGDVPELIKMLDDKRQEVSRAAALSLARLKEESALAAIEAKFLTDPEGMGPALKSFGPKAEAFAADHLFDDRAEVRTQAEKLMEGQPNREKLWFVRAIVALEDSKQRRWASAWLGKTTLTDDQKKQTATAIAGVIESKKGDIPDEMAAVIGETASKEHVRALVEATKHPSGALRRHALKGLARLGDERGLPALAEQFPRDPDGTIKLLKPYGEKGEAILAAFLFDPNAKLRDKATAALAGSTNRDKLFLAGATTALGGTDAGRQKGAMDWLEKATLTADDRKALVPLLAKLLTSKDRAVAERTARIVEPDVTKDQGPELLAALKSPSVEVRKAVLKMLHKVKVEGALPALGEQFALSPAEAMPALKAFGEAAEPYFAKHLFSRNKPVREKAAKALAESPRRDGLYFTGAIAALESKERDVPNLALDWMAKATFTPEQMKTAAPALSKIVAKGQTISSRAMVALAKNAAPGYVAEISVGTKSKLQDVRKLAVGALAKIGDDKACAALCECLAGPSKGTAADALKKLKEPGETAVRAYLMNKSYPAGKAGTGAAVEACKILGAIGGAGSLPVLEELAKDPDRGIAGTARGAINAIKKRK